VAGSGGHQDLIGSGDVATLLGPAHRNSVALHQRRDSTWLGPSSTSGTVDRGVAASSVIESIELRRDAVPDRTGSLQQLRTGDRGRRRRRRPRIERCLRSAQVVLPPSIGMTVPVT
jgi:hypothetical protein